MMNVLEVLEQRPEIEDDLWGIFERESYGGVLRFVNLPVLVPTDENNDINGSQHHPQEINFTYRDATEEDVRKATTAGYYEYFGEYSYDTSIYSGNQYETNGYLFDAIVLDPPAYAVSVRLWG